MNPPRFQGRFSRSLFFLPLIAIAAGCFQTAQIVTAQHSYYQSRYDEAARQLESADLPKRDALLALLEKGMALQAGGRYAESAGVWRAAAVLMDKQDVFHAGEEALSLVFDQNILTYQPAPYERPFLHALLCLDYLQLADAQSARVEALKSLDGLEAREAIVGHMAFVRCVAALAFEATGDLNDAYIEYKKIDEAGIGVFLPDLARISAALGFQDDHDRYAARLRETDTAGAVATGAGMPVIVFLGKSPRKIFSEIVLDDGYRAMLPVFQSQPNPVTRAVAWTDDAPSRSSILLTSVEKLAANYSGRIFAKELLKEVMRRKVQQEILKKVGDKVGSTTESILKTVFFFAKEGDLRTWASLPAAVHLLRVPPAGDGLPVRVAYFGAASTPARDTAAIDAAIAASHGPVILRAW